MLVIFDTNIWLSEFSLNTSLGAATRFFLLQKGARIALPEVVRLEVEHHLRRDLRDYTETIRKNHRQLLNIFGTLKEIVLPDESAIEARIREVFSNLGVELLEIPFSFESAKASFLKTIKKQPPSDKDQQFKDGVLWADCIELLRSHDIHLVCKDKAFYANREYTRGLAENLQSETTGSEHTLRIYPELKDLLQQIKSDVQINDDQLSASFLKAFGDSINNMLSRNHFDLGPRLRVKKALYATEEPNMLSIEFTIEHETIDLSGESRTDGRLRLRGDGMYDAGAAAFASLRNYGEKLTWKLSDGTDEQSENHVAFVGTLVLGHREVTHTVRFKLD